MFCYIGGTEQEGHFRLINEACSMFAHTNPLHLDVFRSVVRFEAEVVTMTAALLGSKEKASGGQICGNMRSGGTESILLAVKSSHDYMRAKKGITKPEMIIPVSAHSAYDQAAQYFKIKLWRVPVNKQFQAHAGAIRSHMKKNTIKVSIDFNLPTRQMKLWLFPSKVTNLRPIICKGPGSPKCSSKFSNSKATSVHRYSISKFGLVVYLLRLERGSEKQRQKLDVFLSFLSFFFLS